MMQPTAPRGYHRLGRSQRHQRGGCSPLRRLAHVHVAASQNPRRPDRGVRQDLPPGPHVHRSDHQRPVCASRPAKPDPARASALSPSPV